MAAAGPRLLCSFPVHTFYSALRYIGMRDRLRCPRCGSVGTWKPHGSFLDREDLRHVRRWMCKWCGLYFGPEGEQQAVSDPYVKAWQLIDAAPWGKTPAQAVMESTIKGTWPWRG